MTKDRPRFDVATLRELAGDKVYARGEAYHRDGMVEILAHEPARVLAQVAGTEDYRTELTGRGKNIDGACSCPAFEDRGFCKHMVATALAANAASSDAQAQGTGAIPRIRSYLKAKDAHTLIELVMQVAERDPAFFRKLDVAAAAMSEDDATLEARLSKAIDNATRTRGFVEYRQARTWAAGVHAALDILDDVASGARARLALKLAGRAIDRIEQAAGNMDDSDGYCGELLHRACEIHLAAAHVARPEPVALARNLFAREVERSYDTFSGAASLYRDVLGESGLAEYRRLANEAWKKLPSRSPRNRAYDEFSGAAGRLKDILDFFAERDGDVAARIALRAKDLTSAWSYLQLAEFCLSAGLAEDALRWAEEGLWMFEDDRPDERLVLFTADLLLKSRRKSDAKALLQGIFEKAPSFEQYVRLEKLGGKAAREQAIGLLKGRLEGSASTGQHQLTDLLIRILMHEKMFDSAWAAAGKRKASLGVREELARVSEATHRCESLGVYGECVDRLADAGKYEEAMQLVVRMSKLRSRTEHAGYVMALKERFGRKRNFMKLLG
jgi:hypothetical protein